MPTGPPACAPAAGAAASLMMAKHASNGHWPSPSPSASVISPPCSHHECWWTESPDQNRHPRICQSRAPLHQSITSSCTMGDENGAVVTLELAKSGRSTCRATGELLAKGEWRVGFETWISGRVAMAWMVSHAVLRHWPAAARVAAAARLAHPLPARSLPAAPPCRRGPCPSYRTAAAWSMP